jgi:hypothetical protein
MKLMKVVLALLAVLGALAAGAAAAGGSLQGEELRNNGSMVLTSFTCTPEGGSVSFTYSGGEAIGPYPGTYEAIVTATSGPLSGPAGDYQYGQLTSLVETFTITSGSTAITGTKTLSQPGGEFYCRTYQPDECGAFDFNLSSAVEPTLGGTDYAATIGGAADYGTATTSAGASGTDCAGQLYAQYGSFLESFDQSLAPHGPATAADCKDGGYASYGTAFKNQGECVSFIERAQQLG